MCEEWRWGGVCEECGVHVRGLCVCGGVGVRRGVCV